MCDELSTMYYCATQIWNHYDDAVTTNTLAVDFFTYQNNTQSKLQVPKIKFSIYSKSATNISVTCSVSELYKYIYSVKKKLIEPLNQLIAKVVNNDKKFTDGFVHKTHKNNIYTTIVYNSLLDSPCIRFMIGEKEQALLDTDKIYIPLIEFNSLYLTLTNCFNNFTTMSQNVSIMNMIKTNSELYNKKLDEISVKLTNVPTDNSVLMERVESKPETISTSNVTDILNIEESKIDSDTKIQFDSDIDFSKVDLESESSVSKESDSSIQNDFDNFIENNVDSFELDLPENDKTTQKEIVMENVFQKKILNNDFSNLKMIINGCVNSNLPLNSFVNTVFDKTGLDLYDGMNNLEKYSINYVISRNLKHNIKNFLDRHVPFPKSIMPIIVDSVSTDENIIQFKVDCMYFLLMSYVYVNRVKNILSEKLQDEISNNNYMCYTLKCITSPFVFSQLMKINKDVIISSVTKLFYDLRKEDFFKKYENEIYQQFRVDIDLDSKYIESEISKIYDNVIKFRDKMVIDKFYQSKIMKLVYSDFKKFEFNFDILSKIIEIENIYWNSDTKRLNGVVTDDIPVDILKKYGIKQSKFDNSVLVNYIKSTNPNFVDLEKIKNININVHDILDQIDIRSYPRDILAALYFWDSKKLPKNITLNDFGKMVSTSGLTISELISLILDKKYNVEDDTFYQSLVLLNG